MYFKQLSGTSGLFNTTPSIAVTSSSSTATGTGLTAANSGQQIYFLEGRYDWICPPGVFSVCVVCVGGGASGGEGNSSAVAGSGGGLGWKNNIPVSPGSSYKVVVGRGGYHTAGQAGITSYFIDTATVAGYGGGYSSATSGPNQNNFGGGWVGDGGGAGGHSNSNAGGAGAGGYTGNGGNTNQSAAPNSGGGGGGCRYSTTYGTGAGGGVGLLGKGPDGIGFWAGNVSQMNYTTSTSSGGGGAGGSGGMRGQSGENPYTSAGEGANTNCRGGAFGGGGGSAGDSWTSNGGEGGSGGVRIIWVVAPTDPMLRQFPSTNTGDIS